MYNDLQLSVLQLVNQRASIREIAKSIGRSNGTAHRLVKDLEESGDIVPPTSLEHRGRQLTEKGVNALKRAGLT